MPYSGLQRGMTQLGAGLGQAFGQRREAKKQHADNKNQHKMLFSMYENMPELQEMIPGLNPDDVSANEAASYMQAFGTMLDVGRQTLQQQQLQQSMQQQAQEERRRQQQERQRQMYADSFGVDRATDPSNLTPKQRYLQRGGNDPALINQLMQFGEQQQGIQFDEDPVSGQRFATFGRSMAGSGVNPARMAESAPGPQSTQGRLMADIRASREAGDLESAQLLENIAQRMAHGSLPDAWELSMYERQLRTMGFSEQEIQEWMRSRLNIEPGERSAPVQSREGFFEGL